jgi:mRNA interferase MazF
MKRGEIWLVSGGVYAGRPRPAIILQDDRFDATESVTVCPLTTTAVDAPLLRLAIAADEISGVREPSAAMIDKITTVRRKNTTERIGVLTGKQLIELERRVVVFLGIGG